VIDITWMSAFVDLPSSTHAETTAFWAAATGTSVSASRGDDGQFVTLEPVDGDSTLRIQRLDAADTPRLHVDFHVRSIPQARDAAVRLGAEVVMELDYAVMRSPGGFVFCFVSGTGDERIGAPIAEPVDHRVDQISIDIPADRFDDEVTFWAELTGWGTGTTSLPEYRSLIQPANIAFQVLFQRLGEDDERTTVDAHLDISCGRGGVRHVFNRHTALGAEVIGEHQHWTTLVDPAGLPYCLSAREPQPSP